jgi:hypothetical protein
MHNRILSRIFLAALCLLAISVPAVAQYATCTVSGNLVDVLGNTPSKNIELTITIVQINGVNVTTYPKTTARSDSNGAITFVVPRSARIRISGPVYPYNAAGGKEVTTPPSATANLEDLPSASTIPTAGITIKDEGTSQGLFGTLNFVGPGVTITPSGSSATITINGGSGAVDSVFGRTGAVVATTNDYTWAQVNKTTSSLADITTRLYSDLQNIPSSFAPSTHASSHAAAGSDPLTLGQSQITGLVAALAAKQDSLGFTAENQANKATTFGTLNNTLYPTTQAVSNLVSAGYQPLSSNLTTFAGIPPSANVQTLLGAADYAAFRSSLSLNNLTNDAQTKASIVPNTAPASGQMLVGNAGGTAYAPVSISGDGTLTDSGALTMTKTGGVSFGYFATGTDASNLTGTVTAGRMPALTGDVTTSAGAVATTLATVNSNVGTFTNANVTVDAKGRITAASSGSAGGVTSVTGTSPIVSSGGTTPAISFDFSVANSFTAAQTVSLAPAANTSTTGFTLSSSNSATSGNQIYSPAFVFTGSGFKTNSTAGAQSLNYKIELQPSQGSVAPTNYLLISNQINGAGYVPTLRLSSGKLEVAHSSGGFFGSGIYSNGLWVDAGNAISLGGNGTAYAQISIAGAYIINSDTGFARDSAGVFRISNGSTGGGALITADPTSGNGPAWKFGARKAATVTLDTTQYIEVNIGGTIYKLAIVN